MTWAAAAHIGTTDHLVGLLVAHIERLIVLDVFGLLRNANHGGFGPTAQITVVVIYRQPDGFDGIQRQRAGSAVLVTEVAASGAWVWRECTTVAIQNTELTASGAIVLQIPKRTVVAFVTPSIAKITDFSRWIVERCTRTISFCEENQ